MSMDGLLRYTKLSETLWRACALNYSKVFVVCGVGKLHTTSHVAGVAMLSPCTEQTLVNPT